MKLYVNLAASNLSTALVKSETSNVPARMPDLVLADTFTLEIYLTDGAGSFAEESGTSGNSIKVGIGIPGQPAVALQDTFSEITDGWSGEVDLATVPFSNLLDGAQSIAGYFEVELTTAEGRRTVAQVPVTLRNEIVAEDALAPEVLPDYYTADEADARFVAKAGDTMTGALQVASELSVKESAPLALALLTVRRSDDEIAVGIASDGSANFSGAVTVGITPTNAGHATRKDYVDAADAANAAAAATALAHADGAQVDADAAQFTADTALSNAAAAQATANAALPKAGGTMTGDLVLDGANIEADGDISCTGQVNIRDVDYIWPTTQGAAGTRLANDGTGVLSWEQNIADNEVTSAKINDGAVTDAKIGNRTITDTSAPTGDTSTLTNLLSWLGNMVKAITGKSSWRTAPRTTLENAVKLNGDTMTGALIVQAAITADQLILTQSALAYSATTDIDFDLKPFRTLSLTGNVTFTTSHKAAGKAVSLKIAADSSTRNFTFPSWVFVGAAAPTSIAANKSAILTLTCFGTADTDIIAAYAVQP